MIYLTSDIHGKTESLMKLLNKAEFFKDPDNWLYILGDVIDKNESGGVDLLRWLLVQPNCQLICGNHELMLLANSWLFSEVTEESLKDLTKEKLAILGTWQSNGAECTISALSKLPPEERMDILEYLQEAPLYDSVHANGKDYLLVHAGLGNYAAGKKISGYTPDELTWTRPTLNSHYSSDFITIVGHTPTNFYGERYKGKILRTNTWWDIDTGAACGLEPMLLCLDTMTEYYLNS